MGKRKRRKTKQKEKIKVGIELYSVLLIIISILGIGKMGPVGQLIASFSLFATGSVYMVLLLILFIVGIYTFIKRGLPDFFSTKMLGFYLFAIGVLTFMHWDFVSENLGMTSLIFRETINQLVKGFNSIMTTGAITSDIMVGGGIIGGIFALIFSKLFAYLGMQIVTITLIIVGLCMFTGFSISEFIKNRVEFIKTEKVKTKENKQECSCIS